jgi:hypothetical protein
MVTKVLRYLKNIVVSGKHFVDRDMRVGRAISECPVHLRGLEYNREVINQRFSRTDVINFLLCRRENHTNYLEIGVRNPSENFDLIVSDLKFSVDPGYEFLDNPVDFQMTSDAFFESLRKSDVLSADIRFDVIFIDGLHLAEQVARDINNSLAFIKEDGFIVVHDCNPPTEHHAREDYFYRLSPANGIWNGTTWKAIIQIRSSMSLYSCTVDLDWGVCVISKTTNLGSPNTVRNDYFEYGVLDANRKEMLNLISFDDFKGKFIAQK